LGLVELSAQAELLPAHFVSEEYLHIPELAQAA